MTRRVIVAMSGGVDSSVAAALLAERGDDVMGVGLRFPDAPRGDRSACCGMAGLEDARTVAHQLGIPFYVLDFREAFEQTVIAPFCDGYEHGRTPNPCIACNDRLKFGRLLDIAVAIGVDCVATGHYARRVDDPATGRVQLWQGVDADHDQTYFLYGLTPRQLARTLFPVGDLTKDEVRQIATDLGLPVADKPSSQDICFVGADGYQTFLAEHAPETNRPGPIVDLNGHPLGEHAGIAGYTLGQRRGLGIAAPEPLYVIALDPRANQVVVGPRVATQTREIAVNQLNWLDGDIPADEMRLEVRLRYRGSRVPAGVSFSYDGASVHLDRPHGRSAPGQAVVFYRGGRVLGGGLACVPEMKTDAQLTEESLHV